MPIILMLAAMSWAKAQQQPVPRDTTYSIASAYKKLVKEYPEIVPVAPHMPPGIMRSGDVAYKQVNSHALNMEFFYPAKVENEAHPAVLLIHGGGWSSGTKSHQEPMAQQLAAHGYVAAVVEYRLSPEAQYPAAVYDLKSAVRYMRIHATRYGIDTSKIAAYGCSAGAHLASLLGTTLGLAKFEEAHAAEGPSSDVQAIVNVDGPLAFIHPESQEGNAAMRWLGGSAEEIPQIWQEASPLTHTSDRTPPILFINSATPRFHAGRDDMVAILDGVGTYSEIHTLSNSPHSFWLFHPWFQPTFAHTLRFLDRVMK
jgi:pectinesterase